MKADKMGRDLASPMISSTGMGLIGISVARAAWLYQVFEGLPAQVLFAIDCFNREMFGPPWTQKAQSYGNWAVFLPGKNPTFSLRSS